MTSLAKRLEAHLRDHSKDLAADMARSAEQVRLQNINFEHQRFINHIPVPYVLEKSRYDELCRNAAPVFAALNRVVQGYRTDPRIRTYFSHLEKLERFLALPVPVEPVISIARFDLVETTSGEFRVVEPNTCCPGGVILASLFYEILKQSSAYKFLAANAREHVVPILSGDTIYNYLISEYESVFGKRDSYNFVIADTRSAPMETELFELRDGARARGYRAEKAQIQDLTYDRGTLQLGEMPVHILYQFLDVLFTDDMAQIAANYEEIAPYLAAMENKAALVLNSFPPILISEDKSILALLHEPELAGMFSAQEHAAIAALVPETYRLRPGIVKFEGDAVDLATLLKRRKDDFLIKAQMESMGRDIVIGRTVSDAQWEAIIAQRMGGKFVAQRFIEEVPLMLPDPEAPELAMRSMNYTLALFFLGGQIKGMCNRVSPSLVTNIGAGGAWNDVFIYDDK